MMLGPACWFGALLVDYALQPLACVYIPWLLRGRKCDVCHAADHGSLAPPGLCGRCAECHRAGALFVVLAGVLMPAFF